MWAWAAIFWRFHGPLDGAVVAQDRRPLVLEPGGGRVHLGAYLSCDRILPALEEELDLGDVGPVVGPGDRLDARPLAALDVEEEAGPPQRAFALADVERACAEPEEATDEVHRLVDARRRGMRSEEPAAIVRSFPRRSTRGKSSVRVMRMYGLSSLSRTL